MPIALNLRHDEAPTVFADQVGEWYAAHTSGSHKAEHGQYLTPLPVARFMAAMFDSPSPVARVLDPGAGSGILSCALCEALAETPGIRRIELVAYEAEKELAKILEGVLDNLRQWLLSRGVALRYEIRRDDFILANAAAIRTPQRSLFSHSTDFFDCIISNPPYFKIPKADPRAMAAAHVVHGQPNIYALFMAVSAYLLKPGGRLIFITPRSFAAGPYFRRFRECFFQTVRPETIHLFGSRTETFNRNAVLQEHVILKAVRDDGWTIGEPCHSVKVSFCAGAKDIGTPRHRIIPMPEVIDMKSHNKFLHIPLSDEEQTIIHLVNSWKGSLHTYGLEISTGPVVPFRATSFIASEAGEDTVPLLWMQNIKSMASSWPIATRKQQYIVASHNSRCLLLPNLNYVLLRRSAPRKRLTESPPCLTAS